MKEEDQSLEQFKKQASELLKQGKPLTGSEGVFTPLIKQVLEAALESEMDVHIDQTKSSRNRRNGRSSKNLKSSLGTFEILAPRDRDSSFTPKTIEKRQTRLPEDLEEKILGLYGLGMSYRDIQLHLEEMYGCSVSEGTINSITDKIILVLREWQSRPLESTYAIVWMDAMHFKIRQEGKVQTKAVYSILGVNLEGKKEVLGLYLGDTERASYWMQVLTDLQYRGVQDILIASIDNLKGFADAIENLFPQTEVQLCVIHQIRNTMKYIPWNKQREFIRELKRVYRATTLDIATHEMDQLEKKYGSNYPVVFKSWRTHWDRLTQYFKYPEPIRKLIYTTNTVEGYHRMVRKVTKTKGAFTSDMAMLKLVYLATLQFEKRWVNGVRNWQKIFNCLSTYYEDRLFNDTV